MAQRSSLARCCVVPMASHHELLTDTKISLCRSQRRGWVKLRRMCCAFRLIISAVIKADMEKHPVIKTMQLTVGSLLSIALLVSSAGPSLAHGHRAERHGNLHVRYLDNSPSAIAERQRHADTFDGTQYFEHDSNKIPLGTLEWWDQKAREGR